MTTTQPPAPDPQTPGRRFRLLHPGLVKMQEDNAELVKRNLARAEEVACLQSRIVLLEEQRRAAQYRLGDCLNFLHDLRRDWPESEVTQSIGRFLEDKSNDF